MSAAEVAPRSTVPSAFTTSGFAARKVRVYMMFAAISDIAHSGIADVSIDAPQLAAAELLAVELLAYADHAATLESCEGRVNKLV